MPSFLKNLRRKSRVDIKAEKPESDDAANAALPDNISYSTLESSANTPTDSPSENGSIPAATNGTNGVPPPLPKRRPTRPRVIPTNRYSMNVSTGVPD